MKPVPRTLLQIVVVMALAIGLGLALNANRPDSLPLIRTQNATAQANSGEISLAEAAALFQAGTALFVDARDELTYAEGHIRGAVVLPVENFEYEQARIAALAVEKTIITYCDGEQCRLSHDLAEKFRTKGVTARVLGNGWTLWLNATLPVTSGPNPE